MGARISFRTTLAAGAAALLLAGCEAQPVGTFEQPGLSFASGQLEQVFFFEPGAPGLRPGEAARLRDFLGGLILRPEDDLVLIFGSTGSERLNAQRIAAARRALPANPARLGLVTPVGYGLTPERADLLTVQVRRYDRLLITCPSMRGPDEEPWTFNSVPNLGCDNTVNQAAMADQMRDLEAPRELTPADPATAIGAIGRYRTGNVKTTELPTLSD